MAVATKVTIGTGRMVSQPYQSQDVCVSVTYELERADTDLLAFVAEKTIEVEQAHAEVWRQIHEIRTGEQLRPYPGMNGSSAPNRQSGDHRTTGETHAHGSAPEDFSRGETEPATAPQKLAIQSLANRSGRPCNNLVNLLIERYGKSTLDELTTAEAAGLLLSLQRGDWSVPEPASA